MNKRQLSRYYYLTLEIKDLEDRIKEVSSTIVGSAKLTGMPHGSGKSDPVNDKVELLIRLKNKLESRKNKSLKELEKIEDYISEIEDIEIRIIFTKRYIQFKRWDEIAKEMCMSESSVFRRHKEQLKRRENENQNT